MRVTTSGVAILRNAVSLGYPFRESLRSLLPAVDELIVNVGQGDDGTWEAVAALGEPKIKPFRSTWDLAPRGGVALSEQTNLAMRQCQGDWILYLQADEVLHEDDLPGLKRALARHAHGPVEGLVFDYLHFYASPHFINDDWLSFYPRAVRAVRNGSGVQSAGDAAGFVRSLGPRSRGLIKGHAHTRIFHYGWADGAKLARAQALSSLYHDRFEFRPEDLFPQDLSQFRAVRPFAGTHPAVMSERVGSAPPPGPTAPYRSPAWLRAWSSFLAAPRSRRYAARPFMPLWLGNLRWRIADRRARRLAG
ncbi:MAG: glycosyltransferase [Vicinamibacteria bacterium]|nr:glycosyltransferase [Vicinamibacteria bacterium]